VTFPEHTSNPQVVNFIYGPAICPRNGQVWANLTQKWHTRKTSFFRSKPDNLPLNNGFYHKYVLKAQNGMRIEGIPLRKINLSGKEGHKK
jgi:hypothetical protein